MDYCLGLGVKNVLASFWELREDKGKRNIFENLAKLGVGIFLDSGAHTLQKGVQRPDYDQFLDEYIKFVKEYRTVIKAYVELDIENIVGFDLVKKWTTKLTREIGEPPIVVWHRERGVDYWEYMCKHYPYIGFSGFVTIPQGGAELPDKYLPIFLKIAQNNNCKVHGFGYTRFSNLFLMRGFYSIDSTSWTAGGRFNRLLGNNIKIKSELPAQQKDMWNVRYMLQQEAKVNNL